jgi:hypothetical protein
MRTEAVEIYSDATNAAIMRHPDRRFPGVLVQGDTLYTFFTTLNLICGELDEKTDAFIEADDLRVRLRSLVNHYKNVLGEHGMKLPFYEQSEDNSTSA